MLYNYYYLIASLPYLNYDDKPPMSTNEFLEQCRATISSHDMNLLEYCHFDPQLAIQTVEPTGSDYIDFFILRERTLILNLAFLRAAKLKRPSPEEPPQDVPRAVAVAKAAVEMDDPLEALLYIDRNRWGALDELIGIDYFGVNNIFAYVLKLQLMERKQALDVEKGFAAYRGIYNKVVNSMPRYKEDR